MKKIITIMILVILQGCSVTPYGMTMKEQIIDNNCKFVPMRSGSLRPDENGNCKI